MKTPVLLYFQLVNPRKDHSMHIFIQYIYRNKFVNVVSLFSVRNYSISQQHSQNSKNIIRSIKIKYKLNKYIFKPTLK